MTVVFLVYWSIPHRFRWIVLLAANAYFYAFYDVKYIIVLLITTVISYYFAILIEKQASPEKRRGLFIAGIVIVLAFLFVFKYLNFTIYSFRDICSRFPHF